MPASVRIVGALSLVIGSLPAQTKSVATKVVWPDEGPATWAPRPTVSAITANDLRTRLYGFSDDSMRGRLIGEPGNYKGTEYIAREFKRMGLKPMGDNGTFFQVITFGPAGFDSSASRLSAGGAAFLRSAEWIPMAPAAGSIAGKVDLAGVPVVFAGRWGDTAVALDPAMFRGKVAVFLSTATTRPPARVLRCDSVPDKFGAQAAAAVEATAAGARTSTRGGGGPRDVRAQAVGAAAVLVIGLDATPAASVAAAWALRGAMQPAADAATAIGGATISRTAATALFGKPVDKLAVGDVGQPVTAQWSYVWKMSATPARNVVAVLPGADPARAAEYVLASAHNDHNGILAAAVDHDSLRAVNTVARRQGANDPVCRPTVGQQHQIDSLIARARSIRAPRRDSIMNGADDDGSGTVVLLEIAEQFAAEKPARSIIFVSHNGEEGGMLGSTWFVNHPTIPLASIVAAHNMDMVGKGRADQVKFGGPASVQTLGSRRLSREFGDVIDSVNATRGEVMAIDKTWDVTANPMNRFCRSDQVNYVVNNVPVTYFSTGYAQDYHMPTDEPRYVEYEHAARVGRFVHDVMMALANRRDRPAISGNDPSYPRCR
ncbi:MAG TPA: M28 family peptidase [Gemmatimonadaceae bacterium]